MNQKCVLFIQTSWRRATTRSRWTWSSLWSRPSASPTPSTTPSSTPSWTRTSRRTAWPLFLRTCGVPSSRAAPFSGPTSACTSPNTSKQRPSAGTTSTRSRTQRWRLHTEIWRYPQRSPSRTSKPLPLSFRPPAPASNKLNTGGWELYCDLMTTNTASRSSALLSDEFRITNPWWDADRERFMSSTMETQQTDLT